MPEKRGQWEAQTAQVRVLRLFILLLGVGFVGAATDMFVHFLTSPAGTRERAAYAIDMVQTLTGLPLIATPGVINTRTRFKIPVTLRALFAAFVFMSITMGSTYGVYWVVPEWDTFLHAFSAALLTIVGLGIFRIARPWDDVGFTRGRYPVGIALTFGYSLAVMGGVLWELYEYAMDRFFGMNMQRFLEQDGTPLVGQAALLDTMNDLVVNSLGALAILLVGYFPSRRGWRGMDRLLPHWAGQPVGQHASADE